VSIVTEVLEGEAYGPAAATRLAPALGRARSMVLTGGSTAAAVYEDLGEVLHAGSHASIFFSDERCVPPDHPASNFRRAARSLPAVARGDHVERMRGEDEPRHEAARYHAAISPFVARGIDLTLLGLGADGHIAALFPRSPALMSEALCVSVPRPDGMTGLTLTPRSLSASRRIFLLVSGPGKAEAVARVARGDESPADCPGRLLADHPETAMLLDRAAAARL
jgi:6-phosphogluconolactonase/glucosamine-6-phosphate isomerase/deaminase